MMSSSEVDTEEAPDAVHHRILQMQANKVGFGSGHVSSEVDNEGSLSYNRPKKGGSTATNGETVRGGGDGGGEDVEASLGYSSSGSSSPNRSNRKGQPQEESVGFDYLFVRRFYRLHGLLFLGVLTLSSMLFLFLLTICLLQEYIVYQVGLIPSEFYKVLGEKDRPGFEKQLLVSCGIIVGVATTKSVKQYLQKVLTATWRQLLGRAVHRLYFADVRFYQLNVLDKSIDNPDQRMTQDIDKFCSTYCDVLPQLLISPFIISYYCYQAYERSGWQGPLGCFAFFLVSTVINKLLMTPIVRYVIKQEQCEGDFRFIHMLIRVNSESIAFLNASGTEAIKTNQALDQLVKTQQRLYFRQIFLDFSVNLFEYLGSIFSYLMLAIPIFSGRYDNYTPAELAGLISENSFVLMYLIFSFTQLVNVSGNFAGIAGVVHRISQLIERLNALNSFWKDVFPENYDERTGSCLELYDEWGRRRKDGSGGGGYGACANGESSRRLLPAVIMKGVTFSPPTSTKLLVSNLNLGLSVGENVLIVGHSSAGKSSLLRVIRGLWPHTEGIVQRYFPPGPHGALFFPQKPYLTIGTLREQICFPLKTSIPNLSEDNLMIHYLGLLRMKSLLERVGGLDVPVSWNLYDSLSPGEMQRLCFIRIFYHRPLLVILDEATSALPIEMENLVYTELHRLGITTITVGHRASLRQYHDKLLTILYNGGWTLEPIVPGHVPHVPQSSDVVT